MVKMATDMIDLNRDIPIDLELDVEIDPDFLAAFSFKVKRGMVDYQSMTPLLNLEHEEISELRRYERNVKQSCRKNLAFAQDLQKDIRDSEDREIVDGWLSEYNRKLSVELTNDELIAAKNEVRWQLENDSQYYNMLEDKDPETVKALLEPYMEYYMQDKLLRETGTAWPKVFGKKAVLYRGENKAMFDARKMDKLVGKNINAHSTVTTHVSKGNKWYSFMVDMLNDTPTNSLEPYLAVNNTQSQLVSSTTDPFQGLEYAFGYKPLTPEFKTMLIMVREGDEVVIDTASQECQDHFRATPFQCDLAMKMSQKDKEVVGEGWKNFSAEEVIYEKINSAEHFTELQKDRVIHSIVDINQWKFTNQEILGNKVKADEWIEFETGYKEKVIVKITAPMIP
jgi:hypothetical protein